MNTKISDVELAHWQELLQNRFPGVQLKRAVGLPNAGFPMIDAYFIPDDKREEFFDFTLRDIIEFREKYQLRDVDFMPFSVSETLQFHPELAEPALAAK